MPVSKLPEFRRRALALNREFVWCLRTGRALRVPRERSRRKIWAHVTEGTLISDRLAEADDRAVPGHWEGDLLIGLERSAIGTVVERTTRFTMLVHLPREEGYQFRSSVKNGPALAGYGAITMKNALADKMSMLPKELARSLTWDRGKEMSAHASFKVETGIPVYQTLLDARAGLLGPPEVVAAMPQLPIPTHTRHDDVHMVLAVADHHPRVAGPAHLLAHLLGHIPPLRIRQGAVLRRQTQRHVPHRLLHVRSLTHHRRHIGGPA